MTVGGALASWRALLTANQVVIYFAYALAFLLMGCSLLLESRRPGQLPLAHHLRFLGLFGVIYAAAIWGKVFIPIQAAFLPEAVSKALWLVDAGLFAAGFTLLLIFGLRLLLGSGRTPRFLSLLPFLLVAVWALLTLFWRRSSWASADSEAAGWPSVAEALARYLLGLPGAVISGLGLLRQRESLWRAGMGHLAVHTDRGGRVLLLYAVMGALLVDAAPIWPARTWNSAWFFRVTLVPVELVRAGLGLVLAWSTVRLLELYDVESKRRDEERRHLRAVVQERLRIARELHDGALQSLFSLGLALESLKGDLTLPELEPQRRQLDELVERLGRISQEIRSQMAGLYRGGSEDEPRLAWEELAAEFEQSFPVQIQLDIDFRLLRELPASTRWELLQITREAVRNGCEHGRASEVVVELAADKERRVCLEIRDNGRGVAPESIDERRLGERGFGLRTMRERARLLGGEFRFESAPGRGATVRVNFPSRQGIVGPGDRAVYGE